MDIFNAKNVTDNGLVLMFILVPEELKMLSDLHIYFVRMSNLSHQFTVRQESYLNSLDIFQLRNVSRKIQNFVLFFGLSGTLRSVRDVSLSSNLTEHNH